MEKCNVVGCGENVSKAGFKLCLKHWHLDKDGKLSKCEQCSRLNEGSKALCIECYSKTKKYDQNLITVSALGKLIDLKPEKLNQIFAELGWIVKHPSTKGWTSLPHGRTAGAIDKEFADKGTFYVMWPETIIENSIFKSAIREIKGEPISIGSNSETISDELKFRQKFPAEHRAKDGHLVRSRGELLIDNYLYGNMIVHAYERRVPIIEDMYCDFYLPDKLVFIEYWGRENDPAYLERKKKKIDLYRKNNLTLLELNDSDIQILDDVLTKKLVHLYYNVS